MGKHIHYVYRITNLENGKFYIGVHSTDDLEDGYMGSGERIRGAIKKHGIDNFTKDILKFFDNRESALSYEAELVTNTLLADPRCYNIALGNGNFAEGNSGRPKGSKNKITRKYLLDNISRLAEILDSIKRPKERIRMFLMLLRMVVPPLNPARLVNNHNEIR